VETRTLSVQLTKQEIIERSTQQAELVKKLEDKEAEKSEATTRLTSSIKELKRELQLVAQEVRAGQRWAEVEVARQKDIKRGVEETIRTDTGEIIETRALTPAEMQLDLIGGASASGKSVVISADKIAKVVAGGGKKDKN